MSFIRKSSGASSQPLLCVYTCPEHGAFEAVVERDENGEAPDMILGCGVIGRAYAPCQRECTWTPTPVMSRVRAIEAVKGKWEKPERPTYLDTSELAEGQDPEEFWAKREAIWEEKRKEDVMNVKRGFE